MNDTRAEAPNKMRVLIVDSHPLFRDGLKMACEAMTGFDALLEAASAEEAVSKIDLAGIDFLITDLALPHHDGFWLIEEVRRLYATLPILVISTITESEAVISAMKLGATGFLTKGATRNEVRTAISDITSGRGYIHSEIAHCFITRVRSSNEREEISGVLLTSREQEILDMLVDGLSTQEIGQALYLSISTVKTHLRALYRKFEVGSRTKLVLKALQVRSGEMRPGQQEAAFDD